MICLLTIMTEMISALLQLCGTRSFATERLYFFRL